MNVYWKIFQSRNPGIRGFQSQDCGIEEVSWNLTIWHPGIGIPTMQTAKLYKSQICSLILSL